mgnify:CR=1 FL=1
MNQYENFEAVRDAFASGEFEMPEEIEVDRIKYHVVGGTVGMRIDEMYRKGMKHMLVYSLSSENRQLAKQQGLKDWIVFIWGFDGLDLVRFDVRMTTKSRGGPQVAGSMDVKEGQQNIIGDVVPVGFINFQNSKPLKGKVDTGATISSLHVDQMKINKQSGQVTFINKDLSPNQITLPIAEQQAVKSSDGGTEYRPIVALNVKVDGQTMNGIQFNLNDRSEMDFQVLIGQNVLEKGGFLIDPRVNEEDEAVEGEVDWDLLQEEFKDVEQIITTQNQIIEMVRQTMSKRVIKALELDGVIDLTPDE